MKLTIKWVVGIAAYLLADLAVAGIQLGTALGGALGQPLGITLGDALPLLDLGLLSVGAVSLIVGVRMARKKRERR